MSLGDNLIKGMEETVKYMQKIKQRNQLYELYAPRRMLNENLCSKCLAKIEKETD